MKTYKVVWEEKKEAIVQAESDVEVKEKVMNGNIKGEYAELTSYPETFILKEEK